MSGCTACGARIGADDRFCSQCGAAQALICPGCATENPPGNRFCPSCGTGLGDVAAPDAIGSASAPVSERRLVSVLFADLVGFTKLSEHRDPEEVRELLSRYFERCRTLIERHGGTVEKFIGDAVMAVWGTPVAREDDAERAVRAALALTQMVSALGDDVEMPELQIRAGVLTGNAAVEVGAEGEGMVLGDTVNTASRLQSLASPGTVLVDEVTRRATEAAIAYEDAGTHEVKGREQPVSAWTALRVVAGVGGARRSAGVEAPLVGRERELQAVIDASETSARDRRSRLVTVVGEAGSGKSRLLWEFFKYIDGIEDLRRWHQGRCLSYGEGVAYWALAEMVRTRARIEEEEDPASARNKLRATVEQFVSDERERRLVEPRLAHLLRLEERPNADRVDLFSGWRLFFERMAGEYPVILAFEDLQWADSGLLEFIDYLLEWSAEFPIFVLALGRPEVREERPEWDVLSLEPLEQQAIGRMLDALAPGLPEDLVAQIGSRAEGIPLYAVETVRMLQDRGILVQDGPRYIVTGDVSDLEVPETLHALVASRLDGLSSSERALLQDSSVLGQSFTAGAAAAVSGRPEAEVTTTLDGLVSKQILSRDDDPRSPERGQYVFLQALLRTVAYGTLSRRARKERHLAAARHLEHSWPGEARDIAEVLASHYLEAIRAEPDADDVPALRASARETLSAAGQAAASLGLGPEAQSYFEQAAELSENELERAQMLEQAGRALLTSGDEVRAEERLRAALDLYRRRRPQEGTTAAVALARMWRIVGRLDEARELLEPYRVTTDSDAGTIERAEALAELAAVLMFGGSLDEAAPPLEEAATTLELEQSWAALADVLVTRAVYLILRHRREEAGAVMEHALRLGEREGVSTIVLRCRFNLAANALNQDGFEQALEEVERGLAFARERGDRSWERALQAQMVAPLVALGRWEAVDKIAATLLGGPPDADSLQAAGYIAQLAAARGDEPTLERCSAVAAEHRESTHVDARASAALVLARAAIERDNPEQALAVITGTLREQVSGTEALEEAYALAIEAAMAGQDEAAVSQLEGFVADLPRARTTPLLRAGRARLSAERAHRRGDEPEAERHEENAIALLRSVGARPLLAKALVERAQRRADPDALAEAREIYADLGATRWLERIDQRSEVAPAVTAQ